MIDQATRDRALAYVAHLKKAEDDEFNGDTFQVPKPQEPTARDADAQAFGEAFNSDVTTAPVSPPTAEEKPLVAETFKERFARERAAGNKVFDWNGKKITTQLLSEKQAAAKPMAKPEPQANTPAGSTPVATDSTQPLAFRPTVPKEPLAVRSATMAIRSPSRGTPAIVKPSVMVKMLSIPEEEAPEMYNKTTGPSLLLGKERDKAPVPQRYGRGGVKI